MAFDHIQNSYGIIQHGPQGQLVPVEMAYDVDEVLRTTGLDWKVQLVPAYIHHAWGLQEQVKNHFFVVREDTSGLLSKHTVSDRYRVIQNETAFNLLRDLLAKRLVRIEMVGENPYNDSIWMLARSEHAYQVRGVDPMMQYFLFSHGHDGATAFSAFVVPIRVYCTNMFMMIKRLYKNGEFRVSHTNVSAERMLSIEKNIHVANEEFNRHGQHADALAAVQLTEGGLKTFLEGMFPCEEEDDDKDLNIRKRNDVRQILETTSLNAMPILLRNSLWHLFQAVTYYVNHVAPVRVGRDEADMASMLRFDARAARRFGSLTTGAGRSLSTQAFESVLEMAGIPHPSKKR